jgi:hypothetical protein
MTSPVGTSAGAWVLFVGVLVAGAAFFFGSRSVVAQGIGVCSFGVGLALYALGKAKLLGTSTFVLKAHCSDAATVGRVLDVTASCRGLDLDRIQWRYDVAPKARATLIEECIRRANERAALVARGLDVKILGARIRRFMRTRKQRKRTPIHRCLLRARSIRERRARRVTVQWQARK